jgi:hypothetical protein
MYPSPEHTPHDLAQRSLTDWNCEHKLPAIACWHSTAESVSTQGLPVVANKQTKKYALHIKCILIESDRTRKWKTSYNTVKDVKP